MPVAKLDIFREDVREFLEKSERIQKAIGFEYVMTEAPEIAWLLPKVVENNERVFRGEVSVEDLWTAITREEMVKLAGMLRHTADQWAAIRMERNPIAPDVRFESADCAGVPGEWQTSPGVSEEKVLLYFHGGGWILGSAFAFRPLTVEIGKAAGVRVLAIDYRLAPEHPFPAAIEDCTHAYEWLLGQGFKPWDIMIGGDSAGGNLALASILALRDRGTPLPRGAVCLSPATDLAGNPAMLSRGQTDPILADAGIFWWIPAYIGTDNPAQLKNPLVSPLHADLRGLPPMLVQATPVEMLFENARLFVENVKASGGEVTFQTWDDMVHVWQLFFVGLFPEAQEAIEKIGEWVKYNY